MFGAFHTLGTVGLLAIGGYMIHEHIPGYEELGAVMGGWAFGTALGATLGWFVD